MPTALRRPDGSCDFPKSMKHVRSTVLMKLPGSLEDMSVTMGFCGHLGHGTIPPRSMHNFSNTLDVEQSECFFSTVRDW